MFLENELRLIWTLTLNGIVLASAYRFTRRWGSGGRIQSACDALLALFAIQYLSVSIPGVAHVYNASTMTISALIVSALLCWFGKGDDSSTVVIETPPIPAKTGRGSSSHKLSYSEPSARPFSQPRLDVIGFIACCLFVVGYVLSYAFDQRWLPPLSTDPIVYHLPTAVQWIQTGKLGLFPTWYWNPAATYSPATSSTFMAWLMAPMGNDALVRFVQIPPLLLIFFVVSRLCRIGGCSRTVAGLIGASAALCRPFFSEAMFAKDDLFITAFFGCAVIAASKENLCDRLGPWRAGLALGMVLASKYTILMACPLFLFLIDAPLRVKWRPRDWGIAIGLALSLSLPWYLRNVWLTGNPIYPVDVKMLGLHGMFTTERDQSLRTGEGILNMLSATYHSMPLVLSIALIAGWMAALVKTGRAAWIDPLKRAVLIGTPVTIVLFLLISPHHEVRYVFPFFLLLFAVVGWAISGSIKREPLCIAIAAIALAASFLTGFEWRLVIDRAILFAIEAGFLMSVGTSIAAAFCVIDVRSRDSGIRFLRVSAIVAIVALLFAIYGFWQPSYLRLYAQTEILAASWDERYPKHSDLWKFVRDNVPPDSTIAFANTSLVYPLYDVNYNRRVVYAPIRRNLTRFLDVPRLGDTVPGDLIVDAMTRTQNTDPDLQTWLENLNRLNVGYLLIHKSELSDHPPELLFARSNPNRFRVAFESDNGVLYQVVQP